MQEHLQKETRFAAKREEITNLLKFHGVPLEDWIIGKTKTISHLAAEIIHGESQLIVENNQLRRKVNVVRVVVDYILNGQKLTLIEDRQEFKDGGIRKRGFAGVSEKMKQGEDPFTSAKRALLEELGLDVKIDIGHLRINQETLTSLSYPGLITDYSVHRMRIDMSSSFFRPEGYKEVGEDKTTYFVWREA